MYSESRVCLERPNKPFPFLIRLTGRLAAAFCLLDGNKSLIRRTHSFSSLHSLLSSLFHGSRRKTFFSLRWKWREEVFRLLILREMKSDFAPLREIEAGAAALDGRWVQCKVALVMASRPPCVSRDCDCNLARKSRESKARIICTKQSSIFRERLGYWQPVDWLFPSHRYRCRVFIAILKSWRCRLPILLFRRRWGRQRSLIRIRPRREKKEKAFSV